MSDLETRLFDALMRSDEDGNNVFSFDDIRHALPYLVIALEIDIDDLSEGLMELFVETLTEANIPLNKGSEALVDAVIAFYEKKPPRPEILEAVKRSLGGDGIERAEDKKRNSLLGVEKNTGVLGGGSRPQGTIPGAMARFGTVPKDPAKAPKK